MTIRRATPEDAKALLEIYAPYVTETAITFEYVAPTEAEFRDRIRKVAEKFPYLMAIDDNDDNEVLGYAYASTFRPRPAYNHCVETSIYIRKEKRHQGIGRALYAELEKLLKAQGILNLNASITTTEFPDEHLTLDSERFHASLGYTKCAHFHKCGYKYGRWYDMIWMEKMIGEHCVLPQPQKYTNEN